MDAFEKDARDENLVDPLFLHWRGLTRGFSIQVNRLT
jgi:hypothetical protein